jgi:hypothetical protein
VEETEKASVAQKRVSEARDENEALQNKIDHMLAVSGAVIAGTNRSTAEYGRMIEADDR